jgi:hypothetical protein
MKHHRTLNPDQAVAVSLPPSKCPQTVTVCAGPEGYRQNTVEVIAPHGTRIRVVRRDTGQVVSQIPHEPSDEG